MEFNFGTANIFDLGKTISDKLVKELPKSDFPRT